MAKFLSGAELDPYKVQPATACWWCGSTGALTREHKFKLSDLRRMDTPGGLVWGDGEQQANVRSLRKSNHVRFSWGLCAPCNNQRSQPFDEAYQVFSDYVWNRPELRRARYLDMRNLYGDAWREGVLNLAKYFVKHIGCRMCHERFPVPASLPSFLNGATDVLPDVQMVLVKSRPHCDFLRRGVRDGIDTRGLWIDPALGYASPSRGRLVTYSSGLIVNFVGVMYRWEEDPEEEPDPFYRYRRARLHWRHDLPDI